jgi:hypothetical protein
MINRIILKRILPREDYNGMDNSEQFYVEVGWENEEKCWYHTVKLKTKAKFFPNLGEVHKIITRRLDDFDKIEADVIDILSTICKDLKINKDQVPLFKLDDQIREEMIKLTTHYILRRSDDVFKINGDFITVKMKNEIQSTALKPKHENDKY